MDERLKATQATGGESREHGGGVVLAPPDSRREGRTTSSRECGSSFLERKMEHKSSPGVSIINSR